MSVSPTLTELRNTYVELKERQTNLRQLYAFEKRDLNKWRAKRNLIYSRIEASKNNPPHPLLVDPSFVVQKVSQVFSAIDSAIEDTKVRQQSDKKDGVKYTKANAKCEELANKASVHLAEIIQLKEELDQAQTRFAAESHRLKTEIENEYKRLLSLQVEYKVLESELKAKSAEVRVAAQYKKNVTGNYLAHHPKMVAKLRHLSSSIATLASETKKQQEDYLQKKEDYNVMKADLTEMVPEVNEVPKRMLELAYRAEELKIESKSFLKEFGSGTKEKRKMQLYSTVDSDDVQIVFKSEIVE